MERKQHGELTIIVVHFSLARMFFFFGMKTSTARPLEISPNIRPTYTADAGKTFSLSSLNYNNVGAAPLNAVDRIPNGTIPIIPIARKRSTNVDYFSCLRS